MSGTRTSTGTGTTGTGTGSGRAQLAWATLCQWADAEDTSSFVFQTLRCHERGLGRLPQHGSIALRRPTVARSQVL